MKKPNVSNAPVSIPKKNDKKNIDLLDLDDEPPKKNNNLLNILGNVNVVAPSSQKKNMPFSKPKDHSMLVTVRNWIKEHSILEGHKRHWQLDDNIKAFYRMNNNKRNKVYKFALIEVDVDQATPKKV
jgi:hypothetical protein